MGTETHYRKIMDREVANRVICRMLDEQARFEVKGDGPDAGVCIWVEGDYYREIRDRIMREEGA